MLSTITGLKINRTGK